MAARSEPSASPDTRGWARRYWWVIGLVISAIVVILAVPLASADPDGLEKVAEDKQFIGEAKDSGYEWLPDYTIPGIDGHLSGIIAGFIGLVIVFVLMLVIGRVLAQRRTST